jgi:hypothetical protein
VFAICEGGCCSGVCVVVGRMRYVFLVAADWLAARYTLHSHPACCLRSASNLELALGAGGAVAQAAPQLLLDGGHPGAGFLEPARLLGQNPI